MTIRFKGFKELENKMKRLSNPAEFFDDVVSDVAVMTMNSLIKKTPVDDLSWLTHTKNLWQFPDKLEDSIYSVDNTKTSKDGKHAIAGILNYGRGVVRPKRAKKLYIPISRKAKNRDKAPGAPIPDDLQYGKDFVLKDKAGPYKGTKFISKVEAKQERILKKMLLRELRKVFK